RRQHRLRLVVPVAAVEDEALERSGRVDDERVAGPLGGRERLGCEPPGRVEVGVEPANAGEHQAEGAQPVLADLGRDIPRSPRRPGCPAWVAISSARWAPSYAGSSGCAVSATSATPSDRRAWSAERSSGAQPTARWR